MWNHTARAPCHLFGINVGSHCVYIYINYHVYSPAQHVRGFTLSDLLDKLMVTGGFPSPPRNTPSFLSRIGFSIPTFQLSMLVDFADFCELTLSRFPPIISLRKKSPCGQEHAFGETVTHGLDVSRDEMHLLLHRG